MGVFTVGRQVALEIDMPGWWLANASVDMDFRRGLYYDSSTANPRAATDFLSCTRASTGYAKDSSGTWISFGSNQLRVTDLGLLIEDARTNNLINSSAPATQTTASLATGNYTLWVEGSGSALASAGSATITGAASATQNNSDMFTVTVAGTVTVTVTGSLTKFQLELGNSPSSFILTAGVAATRAQDLVTFAGAAQTIALGTAASSVIDMPAGNASLPDGELLWSRSFSSFVSIKTSATKTSFWNGSVEILAINAGLIYNVNPIKAGCSWDGSGRSVVAAGGTVVTDAGAVGTATAAEAGLGPYPTGASNSFYAYIRRFTLWNSRLADGTLQTLTL